MLKKSFSRGRRQETGDNPPLTPPRRGRQEKWEVREGRSKNCLKIVLPSSSLKY
ncbi:MULTISPECIES: hypothetical protein [Okeania]|uniref:hypothetical protein n=1 Tax=Okeania TaxID=1458928 RepID=UPI001374AF8A|nr:MULTISPECIES: hypothetical protein [Okeania]NET22851.1 hypothetical protein [Okeania sp. SIO1H5]NET77260.1 hypothetical protein [Okeania sp. SIO1F9]NET93904.1 hypothetical protein [Okeania sp. SIO1H2]